MKGMQKIKRGKQFAGVVLYLSRQTLDVPRRCSRPFAGKPVGRPMSCSPDS